MNWCTLVFERAKMDIAERALAVVPVLWSGRQLATGVVGSLYKVIEVEANLDDIS